MGDFHWREFPDDTLPVFGLAWFAENSPELWRLPARLENVVRPEVWELALAPSGGRIRFASDTTALAVRLSYDDLTVGDNFSKIGQAGLALYADGYYWRPVWPETTGECELTFFENTPKVRREFTIYLPLYRPVKVLAVGLDPGATVWAPEPFAVGYCTAIDYRLDE